eukprot:jgi/Tetstr1/445627/TSEL_003432.t1
MKEEGAVAGSVSQFGPHSIDRFASAFNTLLPRYDAAWLDPLCKAVDSLHLPDADWLRENNWCNVPWPMLPDLVQKVQSGAAATVVASRWEGKAWHRALIEMAVEELTVAPRAGLFRPGRRDGRAAYVIGVTMQKIKYFGGWAMESIVVFRESVGMDADAEADSGGYFFPGDRYAVPAYTIWDSDCDELEECGSDGEVECWSDEELFDIDDTTAAQAAEGKDIQNIPWGRLGVSRTRFRADRLKSYENYLNLHSVPLERLDAESQKVEPGHRFFDFVRNSRNVKPVIVHFQLRNLLTATSKHDVYVNSTNSIMHYNALTRQTTSVLDLSGRTGSVSAGWGQMQVCNLTIREGLMVAGGFYGDLVVHNLHGSDNVTAYRRVSRSENGITNGVGIFESASGATSIVTSNNDSAVRLFDAATVAPYAAYTMPWAVNYSAVNPTNSKMMCVVGDDCEVALMDVGSGKRVASMRGHMDYSFAAAWHPGGHVVATGNQDSTTRLWDVRNPSAAFATLKGRIGAVRSLSYSADGRFLMMAEPADFVHIFDVAGGYTTCQEIDLFGEIAGAGFSPDGDAAFVGVQDARYASLVQFDRAGSGGSSMYDLA